MSGKVVLPKIQDYPINNVYAKDMKRIIILLLLVVSGQYAAVSLDHPDNLKTALLIVDIQEFYFPGEGPGLVNAVPASLRAKEVLQVFREKKQLVVHVRHQAAKGFEIHENVSPVAGEKVITKEKVNAFQGTDLLEFLKENGVTRLIVMGMQTHMCLEAAVRAASDFGFECIVVEDACATRDLVLGDRIVKAEDVHAATLVTIRDGRYGKVIHSGNFMHNIDTWLFGKPE